VGATGVNPHRQESVRNQETKPIAGLRGDRRRIKRTASDAHNTRQDPALEVASAARRALAKLTVELNRTGIEYELADRAGKRPSPQAAAVL
jgi:hypothetical protein